MLPEMNPVNSSALTHVGYDASTQALFVQLNNGAVWQYDGVPIDVYKTMIASTSIGRFFNLTIKPNYLATAVDKG